MEAYKCAFCGKVFASQKSLSQHRETKYYDLWKIEGQTGLARVKPDEIPSADLGSARRISTGNVSTLCMVSEHLVEKLGLRLHNGVWYAGINPSQRKRAQDYLAELRKEVHDDSASG